MRTLYIDIETYSPVDIQTAGVYRYVEHPEFEILLFAYAFDNTPAEVIDLVDTKGRLPQDVMSALNNPVVIKTAYNAQFEITCLSKAFGYSRIIPEQWECTMIKAAMSGLPFGLDAVATVLKLREEKMRTGKALIRYFSMPCEPTRTNGGRNRNLPCHDPDKWDLFKSYCKQDVIVERAISEKLAFYNVPAQEKILWQVDQKINRKGVLIDVDFVNNAIQIDAEHRKQLMQEAVEITGLQNPNSVSRLKSWLEKETGENVKSLSKTLLPELANDANNKVKRVIAIRQKLSKTSLKKYEAMRAAVGEDNRVRGLFQFYGANRTGRWAGRLVQVQNLPQNHLPDIELARRLTAEQDGEYIALCYGNVPDTLSQLIRTAFVAPEGKLLAVADFSAIEARVIAWLAGEKWRMDVFNTHGKIYEASAAAMFKVPIEQITKNNPLRQKGKIAELALGYQGGANALVTMGALNMGLQEDELQPLVDAWRKSNPHIVKLWSDVNTAALNTVSNGTIEKIQRGITFSQHHGALWIKLPSGRELCYLRAGIGNNRFGSRSIVYEGMNQTSKKWERMETYGGKLVENIVQAIARDCLSTAMLRLDKVNYSIVMHVHDEVVIEVIEHERSNEILKNICEIMGQPIAWAEGLPLRADGFLSKFYRKD
jgi:DNA polymerase